jgi:hypothetical protein
MTCTLDGKTLNVQSMSDAHVPIAVEHIVWDTTLKKAVKKLNVYGVSRSWTVAFSEDNVSWSSGSALSFQNTASAGTAVTFAVSDEVRVISASVKIKKVDVGPLQDLAGHNIRHVTLELLETS